MDKNQAKLSIKNLFSEIISLKPSALITLFEIDISDIAFDKGIISSPSSENEKDRIFRFHNNIPALNGNIIWQGKSYSPMPIKAEGFELNGRGTLPVPKLSITTNEEGVPILSQLKVQMSKIGDLIGTKVVRIRTLYKYLDAINFIDNQNPDADPNAEFPRDIYYIDRKVSENKNSIDFELASVLDIEGIKLPARLVIANRCPWQYRGEGCLYESESNRVDEIHGENSKLPTSAPPVATEQGDLIENLIDTSLEAKGRWTKNISYSVGQYVYIEKSGLKYYFVARTSVPQNVAPPDGRYWIADACSKQVETGCKLRWGISANGRVAPGRQNGDPHDRCLPYGGFRAVNKTS